MGYNNADPWRPTVFVRCGNGGCPAVYEVSSFLGGHTFTCNKCGARVVVRTTERPHYEQPIHAGGAHAPSRGNSGFRVLAIGIAALFALLIGIQFLGERMTRLGSASTAATETPEHRPTDTKASEPRTIALDPSEIDGNQQAGTTETLRKEVAESESPEQLVVEPQSVRRMQGVRSELPQESAAPSNGAELTPADSERLGILKISNYTGQDAAVKLKTAVSKATVRFVYVRASSDVTISKIGPGEYVLQFTTGRDWDAVSLAFRHDAAFDVFDKVLSFSERQVEDGTVYSEHEVTLHTVPNGNVRKRAISSIEFSDDLGVAEGSGKEN